MAIYDVFLLTGEWRDERDSHELRFYGQSEELGPVELIFDESKPLFFVDHEEKLPALEFPIERKPLKLKSLRSRPVDGLYFRTWREQLNAADRFKATGVRHFESDVRPTSRFLMERFVYGQAAISGEGKKKGKLTTFLNPKIKSGPSNPTLTVLSLDIETGMETGQLYSIGCHLTGKTEEKRVFMLADERRDMPENLALYPSERKLILAFLAWFAEVDPDLIIGWHVIGFDLMFMEKKCRDLGLTLDLTRTDRPILLTEKPGAGYFATISGRVVIDGIPALRGAGYTFPNYKLETVAQELLGTGKLIASNENKVAEINRQFREDKASLARYNLEDCVLVTQLFDKVDLIPLLGKRCFYSGLLPDQLGIPNAALDHYYLPKLHRKGFVAPDVAESPRDVYSLEGPVGAGTPGIYQQVAVLDFVNVIPSLVRIFKLDPLSLACSDVDSKILPNGKKVSGTEHLLPDLFERLMNRLDQANAKGDRVSKRAIELQLKNFHTVLHAKNNRFYQPELITALASVEKWLVSQAQKFLEEKGYEVISADAEALFLVLKPADLINPKQAAERIAGELDGFFHDRLQREFGFSSVQTVFRNFYPKFLMLPRAGKGTSVKRYAGRTTQGTTDVFGMEHALSTWTELSEVFLAELMQHFLVDDSIAPWIDGFVEKLKQGAFDQKLIYTKKIRKKVEEYAKNAPPHIRAARMLDKPGKAIAYIFTKRGPVPIELDHKDIDYDYYISKHIEPLADQVLCLIGKTYATLSEPEQISLF